MNTMNPSIISTTAMQGFPRRRERVRAKWAPVYLEPMIGSGERITIAVIAAYGAKQHIFPVPHLNQRLAALYERESASLMFAVDLGLEGLRRCFRESGEEAFTRSHCGVEGVFLGSPSESTGDTLEEITQRGIRLTSSLFESSSNINSMTALAVSAKVREGRTGSIEDLVKTLVAQNRPGLADGFEKPFSEVKGSRFAVKVGFVGNRIAANFLEIQSARANRPRKLENIISNGRVKLWTLRKLRDYWAQDEFKETREYALMVQVGTGPQTRSIEDVVAELAAEAESEQIAFKMSSRVEEFAQTIVRKEGAEV